MPELPDITVYIEALERRIVGQSLVRTELLSPFLLRTAEPPLVELVGHVVTRIARRGTSWLMPTPSPKWTPVVLKLAAAILRRLRHA